MSYLHTARIVFSGDFLANPSTINNYPAHYQNSTFTAQNQKFSDSENQNGGWNPEGDGTFDFRNCTIQQYEFSDGSPAVLKQDDPLIGLAVTTSTGRAKGKIVDLDPYAQSCSQLWGVRIQISNKQGDLLLAGTIKPGSFRDMGARITNTKSNIGKYGANWTSVLENITWANPDKIASYPVLKDLQTNTQDGKLSINLNSFGYEDDHKAERFTLGKLIGTIGPWFKGEPDTFAPTRQLQGSALNKTNFLFDEERKQLTFDFGQNLPLSQTATSWETVFPPTFYFGVSKQQNLDDSLSLIPASAVEIIKKYDKPIDFQWLMQGGFIKLNKLSETALALLKDHSVLLLTKADDGNYNLLAQEAQNGHILRADESVLRMDSKNTRVVLDTSEQQVHVYAYQWGKPVSGLEIQAALKYGSPINGISLNGKYFTPPASGDDSALPTLSLTKASKFPDVINIKGHKIGSPRDFKDEKGNTELGIDGQVYFLNLSLLKDGKQLAVNPMPTPMFTAAIYIHLRSYFTVPKRPTWDDIKDVMTQYSNLYPIMSKYVVDLSDEEAVKARKDILLFAFELPIADAHYMPASRDLSEAKRLTILKWLKDLPDGDLIEKVLA